MLQVKALSKIHYKIPCVRKILLNMVSVTFFYDVPIVEVVEEVNSFILSLIDGE